MIGESNRSTRASLSCRQYTNPVAIVFTKLFLSLTLLSASKSIKIISPLNGSPGIHSIDPFGTLPGSGSRLSDMLMSYCKHYTLGSSKATSCHAVAELIGTNAGSNNIIHSRVAVKHMPGWMSYAVSSPPLYYSTMFMSALRLLLDLNTPEVQLALLHYQGEAIRAVNKCLQDNNKYVETETICAVACLVQGEVRNDSC